MLVISSQVFRIYCVLSEEGQVGRNMSQNTLIICKNPLCWARQITGVYFVNS